MNLPKLGYKTPEGASNDMKKCAITDGEIPSRLIDARIRKLDA